MPRPRISEKMAAKIVAYRAAKKELDDSRMAHKQSLDRVRGRSRTTKLWMAEGGVGDGDGDDDVGTAAPIIQKKKVCHHCDTAILQPSEVSKDYCTNSCASADGWFKGRD